MTLWYWRKIGDKVRNIHDGTEGRIVYSTFGASVSRWKVVDREKWHFQTLGCHIEELEEFEEHWEKIKNKKVLKLRRKYQVWYQRQSDMVVSWIFVDATGYANAMNIAQKMLKGERILYAREV